VGQFGRYPGQRASASLASNVSAAGETVNDPSPQQVSAARNSRHVFKTRRRLRFLSAVFPPRQSTRSRGGHVASLLRSKRRLVSSAGNSSSRPHLKRFERRGVSLVSVAHALDTRSAGGRLGVGTLWSACRNGNGKLGERRRDAVRHKRAKGECVGTVPCDARAWPKTACSSRPMRTNSTSDHHGGAAGRGLDDAPHPPTSR
jgi:hypothetical protein